MNPPARIVGLDEQPTPLGTSSMEQPIYALTFVNAALRNRWRIVAIVTVAVLIGATVVLRRAPQYVSSAAFSLQGANTQRLSGLAAQFGFALPVSEGQLSPAFYQELLESREILSQAATTTYTDSVNGRAVRVTLPQVYRIRGKDSASTVDDVVRRLERDVSTGRSRETGIVRVSASAPSPVLAQNVLTRLIALVNDFNLKTRQSQAANERRFVERRLAETRTDLRAAEDRLQQFLQRNRGGFSNVPELSFAHDRLARDVTLQQQLYSSLSQSYEQARLDEVRDTPAITMIESPNRPIRRAPRGLLRTVALAVVIGLLVGLMPLAIRALLSRRQHVPGEELAEFQRLREQARFWPLRARPSKAAGDG